MEQQIQDLVASIKRDGLETAKHESEKLLNEAKEQAQKIVADAKKKAEKMLSDAHNECALRDQSAKASIAQAGRDVSLSLKTEIEKQFSRILTENVGNTLKGATLANLVATVVKAQISGAGVVEVNPKDVEDVTKGLKGELAKELEKGLEIKASPYVKSGFHLKAKDGSWFLDLSAEEIGALLMPYVSTGLQEIISNK
ncbi:MAG: V-type ATP synthase subunit E [Spirochaetales bacterium]|jgi:V/A-type H+/Na+-transporting ATPase subunit E|nr:V-type ATP synthase subunit E [Spirochaetales bacterium]